MTDEEERAKAAYVAGELERLLIDRNIPRAEALLFVNRLVIHKALLAFAAERPGVGEDGRETWWLIERRCSPPLWIKHDGAYLTGSQTDDIEHAHRYPTKRAAQNALRTMSATDRTRYLVTEHVWIDGAVSLSPAPVKQSLTTGEGETAVIEDCARRALQTTEMARTDVVNPVNGSAPYSYVSFHGQRVVFSDDEFTISQHRDAGTGKAAAYATKINDALFDLAKRAAANTIRLSAPPILATGGEGKVRTCKHCLAALSPTPVAGGGE